MDIQGVAVRVDAAREQLTVGEQLTQSASERRRALAGIVAHLIETLQGLSPTDLRTDIEELGTDLAGSGYAFQQACVFLIEAARGSDNPLVQEGIAYAGSAHTAVAGEEAGATLEVPVFTEQLDELAGGVDALLMTARGLETTLAVLEPAIERAQGLAQHANRVTELYREGLGAAE